MSFEDEFIDRENVDIFEEKEKERASFDITKETKIPIKKPPKIFSTNGIGLRLSDEADYDPATHSYVMTLYQTLFYMPICPMRRFRVSKKGNVQQNWNRYSQLYDFLWELPLREDQKTHKKVFYAASWVAILLFVFWVYISLAR
jgi:hypothetical protein